MEKIKTGVELIAAERQKQIDKHNFTGEHHANHPEWYDQGQLLDAARVLSYEDTSVFLDWCPENWGLDWFRKLLQKPHKERIVISGALIASELDRLNALGK